MQNGTHENIFSSFNIAINLALVGMLVVFIALSLMAIVISCLNHYFSYLEKRSLSTYNNSQIPANTIASDGNITLPLIASAASIVALLHNKQIETINYVTKDYSDK